LDVVGGGGNGELIVTVIIGIMLATDGNKYMALNNDLPNSDINLRTRQPQQHCAKRKKENFLVEAFWIYQNYKSFGTPEANQNFQTKFVFFFSHKQKLPPKLASPIGNKNTQRITSWYMTSIQQERKKTKKNVW
jgi:hypothetical protein